MLVNALSVVKSFYSYPDKQSCVFKFIRLSVDVALTTEYRATFQKLFPIHSHFRKYSPLHFTKKAGAELLLL